MSFRVPVRWQDKSRPHPAFQPHNNRYLEQAKKERLPSIKPLTGLGHYELFSVIFNDWLVTGGHSRSLESFTEMGF